MDVRPAIASDIDAAVDLAERTRRQQQKYQPIFWRKAAKSAELTKTFFSEILAAQDTLFLVATEGRQVLGFGEKTQYGGQSKGLVLETRTGAQVTSPCDGWIVYAGEFRSYGQLLIINAGGGYHVLLAGLSQIDVQPGQFVLGGEPVGTMSGWTQQAQSATANNAPVLYVEFRKDGTAIDPDPWWVQGHQKVQG